MKHIHNLNTQAKQTYINHILHERSKTMVWKQNGLEILTSVIDMVNTRFNELFVFLRIKRDIDMHQ